MNKPHSESNEMQQKLSGLARVITERLTVFFREIEQEPPSPLFETRTSSLLFDQVRDLTLRSGKRLRAVLLVQGASLFDENAEAQSAVIDAAAAIELLQTYFLIHDDIMDDDDTRRGGPAVHVALASQTNDKNLGQALGILAGDLAHALEQVLLTGIALDAQRRHRVVRIFTAMHLDVMHGQTLDLLGEASAVDIATHKTASYTTVGPLAAGAALAGARDEEIAHLARIALPLGIAFQFRDDLLGTFGRPEITGKSAANDLCNGKRTALLEEGLKRANAQQKAAIEAVLGLEDAESVAVETARQALISCGAHEAVRHRIDALVAEFVRGIESAAYRKGPSRFLVDVARYIAERKA